MASLSNLAGSGPVGAENAVTLRDLGIFVGQAAGPVPTHDPDILAHSEWTLTPGGRSLAQRPVRAMNVIVLDVLTQAQPAPPARYGKSQLNRPASSFEAAQGSSGGNEPVEDDVPFLAPGGSQHLDRRVDHGWRSA